MISLIVYFFPAIASVWFFERLGKATLTGRKGDRLALGTNLFSDTPTLAKKWVMKHLTASLPEILPIIQAISFLHTDFERTAKWRFFP